MLESQVMFDKNAGHTSLAFTGDTRLHLGTRHCAYIATFAAVKGVVAEIDTAHINIAESIARLAAFAEAHITALAI